MGNMESRQFADALLRACQEISGDSGDNPPDRLLVPEFLDAIEVFLEQIKSNWDKLPSSVADIVKNKFIPRFGPTDDPKGDPEAWVQQQIVREPDNDFPIHLYDELVPLSLSRTTFEVAKRNVLLVAFSNLQAKGGSGLGRSVLTRYLITVKEEGSEEEKRKIRQNCSFFATAGDRLKSCLGKVGGPGALICGLAIPMSNVTHRWDKQSLEELARSVDWKSSERCGRQVDALLTLYETQASVWADSQTPPGRKRKRKTSPAPMVYIEQPSPPLLMTSDRLQHIDTNLSFPSRDHFGVQAPHHLQASPAGASHPSAAQGTGGSYSLITQPAPGTSDEELVGISSQPPSVEPVSDVVVLVEDNRSYRGVAVNTEQQHTAYPIVPSCEYSGPRQWFINGAIGGEQNSTPYIYESGPQRPLAVQNVVPDTALSVIYAMNGNISGLRELFSQGRAQPGDQSATRGFSLVRWALYGGLNQYATVQYLLQEGAPVDNESYDHVNDFIYRKKCNPEEEVALKPIWSDRNRDWFDDQHFPRIHRILLAEDPNFRVLLVDELRRHPNAILEKDAKGRTALDWATARAQLKVMELLIRGRSNVNSMDSSGRTTVLHAVDSHNHAALEMVLKAGANPNPEIREGWHRSSPLTSASFGGLTEMVDLLLEHGATINTRNPEGRAALHTAIIRNKHEILRIFIKKFDGDCLRELELLPVIAQHADEKAMSILATSSQFLQVFYHDYDDSIRDFLEQREDYSSELHAAFDGLLIAASDRRSST
ncbi:hypothetical protein CLIM01_14825 [Colletotrichum limetticola]|uniref:Ankyrin repeat protein n=1 Tax=Colletotrichum limetticola TaxID=1209924 RepID=A0ABQ9P6W5_9PEZI|nr:hypothetical protein CLIM01_14825 [Colletotrichum limetticola]